MTRRTLAATALVTAAAPTLAQPRPKPLVIAHRGASGERPEHTLLAYREAIAQGADFIEPDLVATKDGVLVARHENEIAGTTDVAARPEFAARKTIKTIDGEKVEGWFTEDFTLAELKTLRCRERLPQLRPVSAAFDGNEAIPTFREVLDLARLEGLRAGRTIGIYPELKHPTYFGAIDIPLEAPLLLALRRARMDDPKAPVFIQCFEAERLKALRPNTRARLVQLVGADRPEMVTPAGLKAIAAYANGVGTDWSLVLPTVDGGLGPASTVIRDAHAAGLQIHPWTVRAENFFLPAKLKRGTGPAEHGDAAAVVKALFAAGADGVFTDFPGLAVRVRDAG